VPRYRKPGVYIPEPGFRPPPIEGVDTAVTGLVGPTRSGPVRGEPVAISSFVEFEQRYGNADDLSLDGRDVPNYTALAAQAFFRNGGERLVVVRTLAGVNGPGAVADTAPGAPSPADYAGQVDERNGSTGLAALESVPEIAIVMAPAAAAAVPAEHGDVIDAVARHCRRMRHRIGLVDPRATDTLAEVQALAARLDDANLALYYPWVIGQDPTGRRATLALPPSGFIAGLCARNDRRRGVHRAPAGLVVTGALGLTRPIDRQDQALLNPQGINCLRTFPHRGHVVWGARTLSADPEWRYLNVRRLLAYLQRSVEAGLGWVGSQPNGEPLWAAVRGALDAFLGNEWRQGRLQGATPREAYYVRCDRSTMTQADIDNGRLIAEIGVAALRPAEFLVFRVQRDTRPAGT